MNAQKLQSSVVCAGQLELFVKDGNYQIGSYSNPYLRLHGVGTCPVVMLDPQVPLDPAEEQLDAPPHLVKHGHGKSRNLQVVGQEYELLYGFRIVVFDPSQKDRERRPRFFESRLSNMVAAQSSEPVHRHRVMPRELKVALRSRHKKGSRICYQNESCEVHVATVYQIECSSFEQQAVEPSHVALPRSRNMDAGRNRAAQIDLSMENGMGFQRPT